MIKQIVFIILGINCLSGYALAVPQPPVAASQVKLTYLTTSQCTLSSSSQWLVSLCDGQLTRYNLANGKSQLIISDNDQYTVEQAAVYQDQVAYWLKSTRSAAKGGKLYLTQLIDGQPYKPGQARKLIFDSGQRALHFSTSGNFIYSWINRGSFYRYNGQATTKVDILQAVGAPSAQAITAFGQGAIAFRVYDKASRQWQARIYYQDKVIAYPHPGQIFRLVGSNYLVFDQRQRRKTRVYAVIQGKTTALTPVIDYQGQRDLSQLQQDFALQQTGTANQHQAAWSDRFYSKKTTRDIYLLKGDKIEPITQNQGINYAPKLASGAIAWLHKDASNSLSQLWLYQQGKIYHIAQANQIIAFYHHYIVFTNHLKQVQVANISALQAQS